VERTALYDRPRAALSLVTPLDGSQIFHWKLGLPDGRYFTGLASILLLI